MDGKRKFKDGGHERRSRKSGCYNKDAEDKDIVSALELLLGTSSQQIQRAVRRIVEKEIEQPDPFAQFSSLGSAIISAEQSIFREYSAKANSEAWPFSEDVSAKIFSMVDTASLVRASASCTLWRKISQEPACYKSVDLTVCGSNIPSGAVTKILERAGPHLKSLKLGLLQKPPQLAPFSFGTPKRNVVFPASVQQSGGSASQTVSPGFSAVPYVDKAVGLARTSGKLGTRCLDALSCSSSLAGTNVTTLHLYNISPLGVKAVCRAIVACPQLEDLEIVGLQVSKQAVMDCVGGNSAKLKRFFFQPVKDFSCSYPSAVTQWSVQTVRMSTYQTLVSGCPDLSSLSLRDGNCNDKKAMVLLKNLDNLKELDLSRADYLTGSFLQSIIGGGFGKNLERLVLRDCMRLKEASVESFLTSLLAGEMKQLVELDISNKNSGFAKSSMEWFARRLGPNIMRMLTQLRQERPTLLISAEFSHESDSESLSSSDDSDDSDSDSDMRSSSSDLLGLEDSDDDDGEDDDDEDLSDEEEEEDDDDDDGDNAQGHDGLDDENDDDADEDHDDSDEDDDDDEDFEFGEDGEKDENELTFDDEEEYEDSAVWGEGSDGLDQKTVNEEEGCGFVVADVGFIGKGVNGCQERCMTNFSRLSHRRK